jgi:sortase A
MLSHSHKRIQRAAIWLFLLLGIVFFSQSILIQAKAIAAQILIKQSWQKSLDGVSKPAPWPWADTWPIARLVFPNHDQDLYALAGSQGTTLAFGPDHLDGSSLPGQSGTKIFSAHRDTHFQFFEHLELGDLLYLQNTYNKWTHYKISNIRIVDTETKDWLIDPSQDQVLLITCYPFHAVDTGGSLRFIATATPTIGELAEFSSPDIQYQF